MKLKDADALVCSFCNAEGIAPILGRSRIIEISDVVKIIEDAPTVDAVPVRRGRWEKITGMAPPEFHGHYTCSICGWCDKRLTTLRREMDYNFCPNCGADMREE